jgi:hypothetical protein
MADDKPRLIETGASVSTGGKVQLKKYELSADYHLSLNAKWTIPPGMSEDEAEEFRHEQILRLKRELEPLAQAEVDDLLEQKETWG